MGMTRGTALVPSVARVTQLTGQQGLASLEAASELTLTDLLTSASDAIYDRLEADGVDPTLLTNQSIYERAVAWEFLSSLFALGYASNDPPQESFERAQAQVERYYAQARPKTTGDTGRRANEAIPIVANWEGDTVYDTRPGRRDLYRTRRPRGRN